MTIMAIPNDFSDSPKTSCEIYYITRKCPLRGHILAPPEGLRAPGVPKVNPVGRPQESGGDSKAI